MRHIKTLEEYKKFIAEKELYVRYTPDLDADLKYETSTNHQNGDLLAGLSVNPANQLTEYVYCSTSNTICYLLTGREVGRGPDNEPLLKGISPVAIVDYDVIHAALAERKSSRYAKIATAIRAALDKEHPEHWYYKRWQDNLINLRLEPELKKLGVWGQDIKQVLSDMGLEED
jgi:hypothetical protein